MGYRSQVGAVLSVDGWTSETDIEEGKLAIEKYREMIGLIKLSKFYELMQQSEQDRKCIGWRQGEFFFHADQWKWYPDYDIVQAWEELWVQMQEVERVSGYFVRVGEEVNDIAEENFGDEPDFEAFYPHTYMSCEVANETFGGGDIDAEIEEWNEVKRVDEVKQNLTMLEGN
jgi:hypothetical protein